MSKVLAARLKSARHAMHPPITQREIAKRFRVTPGSVSLWESGATEPRSEVLAQLAGIYGVSVDWLVGLDEKRVARVKGMPLHSVPVVSPQSLAKWRWDAAVELLQTSVLYPPGTALAVLVSTDALTSSCPTGAYAVVSKAHSPTPGCIVAATAGKVSDPILRRWVQEGGNTLLMADDARWPTVRVADGTRVIGKVVEVTIRRRLA